MKLRIFLCFILGLAFALSCSAADLHLFIATQSGHLGDMDQVHSLAKSIEKLYTSGKVQTIEFDLSKTSLKDLRASLESDFSDPDSKATLRLLLTAGHVGSQVIQTVSDLKNLKTVHMAHQLSHQTSKDGLTEKEGSTFLILPKTSITPAVLKKLAHSKTKLLETVGVLHNLGRADVIEEYEKNRFSIPLGETYLGVIIGGDAPTPDGKMLYFSQADAEILAAYVAKEALASGAVVLAVSSPRTGKHDPKTGAVNPQAHNSETLDPITSAFQKKLQSLIPASQLTLFDYQQNKKSLYKTVLGAVLSSGGNLLVPGESTSMLSETIETFGNHVYAYENSSINPVHLAYLKKEYEAGKIHLLHVASQTLEEYPCKINPDDPIRLYPKAYRDAQAAKIAQEILKAVAPRANVSHSRK